MIGDPVALTIRRKIERPAAKTLRAFAGAPTGFVTDAFNGKGCLDSRIKPIDPAQRFSGTAVTCFCGPMDNLAAMAALDFVRKGDVIVIATTGDETAAVIGDHWLLIAKNCGVVGIVCDGLVRDVEGLLKVGLPVFARGWNPNSGFRNGPGEINTPVSCGGVLVNPGDIVVGDRDGVVVVPRTEADAVAHNLKLVDKKEREVGKRIKANPRLRLWNEAALEKRGGVRYLD
jgi:4-hydroxy-4-methyl-2-oxoglutarate aldolase